jgi:beta-N-acetylhexosaminidase
VEEEDTAKLPALQDDREDSRSHIAGQKTILLPVNAPERAAPPRPARPFPAAAALQARSIPPDLMTPPSQPGRPVTPLQPVPVTPLQPVPPLQAPRKRRLAIPVAIALVLLAAVIVSGAIIGQSAHTQQANNEAALLAASLHAGPFVASSLTAQQRNALMHLTGYMKYKQLAALYVARMSLDVEIGQTIMVEYGDTHYSGDLNTMITQLHAGGVIMYQFQMPTFSDTKEEIAQMQAHAAIPLLVSTDEEGGPYVDRLTQIYGPRMSPTQMEETGDPNVAAQQGKKTAHDLLALGINTNLAPDVDVNLVNGYDMVTRTFGNTAQQVIEFAGPYLQALQSSGVIGTIKHFPGLGDAVPDAHKTLPVVNQTKAQIYSIDLAPFKAFIQSHNALENPGIIMPTDVLMPAIDPTYPAELSHTFMTDILRNQFGYDGVTLTDALYMQGITDQWSMPQAAVMALAAGNDMILGPTGTGQTIEVIDAIKQALQDGQLSKARLDQAVTRIIALKMEYHLMPAVPPGS